MVALSGEAMTKNKNLIPTAPRESIRVELEILIQGKKYRAVHVFREPMARDKKEYLRATFLLTGSGDNQKRVLNAAGAAELLWGACLKSVEGYDLPEGCGLDMIRERIPLEHKIWAVDALLARVGELVESKKKN